MWEVWDLNFSKDNLKQTWRKHSFWWQQFWRLWIYTHCKFLKETQINICQKCLGCVYSCSRQWYRPCDSSASALCDLLSWEVNERGDQGEEQAGWKAQWEQFVEWLWWHENSDIKARSSSKQDHDRRRIQHEFRAPVSELCRNIMEYNGCGASLSCFSSSFCFWFLTANFVQLCAVSFLSLRW